MKIASAMYIVIVIFSIVGLAVIGMLTVALNHVNEDMKNLLEPRSDNNK